MSQVFLTADLHFGHRNIIPYCGRPFTDVEDMRRGLIERWNSVVRPDDTVWVLGDFSLHPRGIEAIVPALHGTKRLIAGNHDAVWSGHSRAHKYFSYYLDIGFASIDPFRKIKLDGLSINLSHFPYATDPPGDERYPGYRLVDLGLPLAHGHVHSSWRTQLSAKGTPMVNVGVDVWDWTPVPADRVRQELTDQLTAVKLAG